MVEIVKTLENLKSKKDALDKEIELNDLTRAELENKLNTLQEEYEKVCESIEQKKAVLNVYDKILTESDSAYSKIVKSTEALYQMILDIF